MDISELETISTNAIVFQSVADVVISNLKRDYLPLLVSGVNDKEGCKVVNEARKHVKKLRTGLEVERKKKKAKSLEYGRNLDGEAKRLSKQLVEIEEHLLTQEKIVTDEFARVKEAEQKAIEDKHKQRIIDLIKAGAVFDGLNYIYDINKLSDAEIWNLDDNDFNSVIEHVNRWIKTRDEERAERERQAKIELDKQKEIDKAQREKQEKIDADSRELQDRMDKLAIAEKKLIDDRAEVERVREIEGRKIQDAKELKEKKAKDNLDKINDVKRKMLFEEDKQKLTDYILSLTTVGFPDLEHEDSKTLLYDFQKELRIYLDDFRAEIEFL